MRSDLRIGSCPALAALEEGGTTTDVVPCGDTAGHYPERPHRAVTVDGKELGTWTDR